MARFFKEKGFKTNPGAFSVVNTFKALRARSISLVETGLTSREPASEFGWKPLINYHNM